MPDAVWQFGLLLGGFYAIMKTVDPKRRRQRLLLWAPVPVVYTVMWFVIDRNPAFWESDRAALPTIVYLACLIGYGLFAVRAERKLK
ncbi:MAG TPA: hypothetical protein VGK74_27130 [Symbiobacteriaceae bacterium]|jgi:hypothetical protein